MWLLNTTTLHLKEFSGSTKPAYAILSHTWFESEVLFHEIHNDPVDEKIKAKPGFSKIRRFCELAKSRGFDYGWVDSCCIDKRSSAELSEAIGSMFAWYRDADICIVYLEDVPAPVKLNDFKNARWFTRGWTLQELIASENRSFFAKDWSEIVDWYFGPYGELDMLTLVAKITGVKASVLRDSHKLWACCIAERMSWASSRQTTRPEDRAYSLMGLFDINISIQYGEGLQKAFARLQKEILRTSFDDSIFVWHSQDTSSGLLAQSPDDFVNTPKMRFRNINQLAPCTITDFGIYILAWILNQAHVSADSPYLSIGLMCEQKTHEGWKNVVLRLRHSRQTYWVNGKFVKAYYRVDCDGWQNSIVNIETTPMMDIFVLHPEHDFLEKVYGPNWRVRGSSSSRLGHGKPKL